MAVRYQLVINCADPELMARFWAAALGYELEPPPPGFATWDDWRRDLGFPEDEVTGPPDSISDPAGQGPRIWFQVSPDAKTVPNRLHIDVHASGGRALPMAVRRERVDAEARRLAGLGGTLTHVMSTEGFDHYAVGMTDPEGNEFDIN